MMTKRHPFISIIFIVWTCIFVLTPAAYAIDCRIISWERISPTGYYEDYKILFNVSSITKFPIDKPFFNGQKIALDRGWGFYDDVSYLGNGIAQVIIKKWKSGAFIEFSTGIFHKSVPYYTSPIENGQLVRSAFEGHYRIKLGAATYTLQSLPWIPVVLLKKKQVVSKHACVVLNVKTLPTSNATKNYELTLSLQNFLENAPLDTIPVIARQSAYDSTWTEYYQGNRYGDVAIFNIADWSGKPMMQFSFKLIKDGRDYWPNVTAWNTSNCSNHIYANEHFVVNLEN